MSLLHDIVTSVAPIREEAASPHPRQLGGQGSGASSLTGVCMGRQQLELFS